MSKERKKERMKEKERKKEVRGASLRLFCYPDNRFLIRSVNRVTVHNSEICKKGPKQK